MTGGDNLAATFSPDLADTLNPAVRDSFFWPAYPHMKASYSGSAFPTPEDLEPEVWMAAYISRICAKPLMTTGHDVFSCSR